MTKVSVIVPYYNGNKELLYKCIKSICQQTFSSLEILLIDDGSQVEGAGIADEVSVLDPRIRVFHKENGGVSTARNFGIKQAEGEYIMFVDADDILAEYCIASAVSCAENSGADFIIGGITNFDDFAKNYKDSGEYGVEIYEKEEIRQLRYPLICQPISFGPVGRISRGPVARLIRTGIVKDIPFVEGVILGEDIIWNLDVLRKCSKVCLVKQIWYYYYYNAQSASHNYNPRIVAITENTLKTIYSRIDVSDAKDFEAYGNLILEELHKVYQCLMGTEEWKKVKSKKRRALVRHLYNTQPWCSLTDKRFYQMTGRKNRLKINLYKYRLLFFFMRLGSFRKNKW